MSAEVIEMTPHTLQRAGVVTEGNQYVQSTAVAPVASMFSGLTRQERELAITGLVQTASGMLKQAMQTGESAEVMSGYKDQAAAIADLTKRIDVSKDAVLDAQVLQRRAERGLGVAIRAGQAEGKIRTSGQGGGSDVTYRSDREVTSPTAFASKDELSGNQREFGKDGIYALADNGTDSEFDDALTEAREERNVSRANVVRKLSLAPARTKAADDAREAHRSDMQSWHGHLAEKYPLPRLAFDAEGHERHSNVESFSAAAARYGAKYQFHERSYARHAAQSADWLERSSMNLEVALDVLTHIDFSTITPEQAHEALQRIEALPRQLNLYIRELKGITNE